MRRVVERMLYEALETSDYHLFDLFPDAVNTNMSNRIRCRLWDHIENHDTGAIRAMIPAMRKSCLSPMMVESGVTNPAYPAFIEALKDDILPWPELSAAFAANLDHGGPFVARYRDYIDWTKVVEHIGQDTRDRSDMLNALMIRMKKNMFKGDTIGQSYDR